jgi:periplasmic divalent cation tolerance protein
MAKRRQYIQLQLTCADAEEAATITGALLGAHLIVCAKRLPVESANWWQGEIEQGSEVLLLMESAEDFFPAIEEEITKLHSYETFVLTSTPLLDVSAGARVWMDENLKGRGKK